MAETEGRFFSFCRIWVVVAFSGVGFASYTVGHVGLVAEGVGSYGLTFSNG